MYKRILSVGMLAIAISGTAYSQEQGGTPSNVKFGFGIDPGFSVLLQFDNKINLAVGNDGVTADYLFRKGPFDNQDIPFTWYVGGGARVGWGDDSRDFGVRMPLGLNWGFSPNWEAYGQIHPELEFNNRKDDLKLGMGAAVGIRYDF
ncbi:hypothetical protein P7F88_16815 [Vibrio hannami]|uniref:hypothetical protein n=1 Tax=Vibrio hannami TaxID=2717094 RepID=UPI00240F7821|nr:hypothetical protein [Vibrio hannami]MDG3087633.1 hypothetical protein [Vibrio hannami]